jgi:hypothetical protein
MITTSAKEGCSIVHMRDDSLISLQPADGRTLKRRVCIQNHGDFQFPNVPHAFECGEYLDLNEKVARLQDDASSKGEAGRKSKILVKYLEFRIVLIAMKAASKLL